MSDYDDLQRFKEKTRTQRLDFKELSTKTAARERGNWAILDQLSPPTDKDVTLAVGGSVSQAVPRPVSADAFVPHELEVNVTVNNDATHEPRAASIMQSVASQMRQHAEPDVTPTPPMPEPVEDAITVQAQPVQQSVSRQPKPTASPEAVNYSRLFTPKYAEPPGKAEKEEKNQPLKSLLERIASCR